MKHTLISSFRGLGHLRYLASKEGARMGYNVEFSQNVVILQVQTPVIMLS